VKTRGHPPAHETHRLPSHTCASTPSAHRPPQERISTKPLSYIIQGEMNPTAAADQNPAPPISSSSGKVTDSSNLILNNRAISIADEKRSLLEWLSPLEPRERHQTIGMSRVAGVGDRLLLTKRFTRWSQSGDRSAKPVLFCYGEPGAGKTYLKYG